MGETSECALCFKNLGFLKQNEDEAVLCDSCVLIMQRYRRRAKIGLCPFCCNPVKVESLVDGLSLREFMISGLCQKCQDGVFKSCK